MAPVVPKKPLKSMEKSVKTVILKRKTKKRNYQNFAIYIYKVLKMVANSNNMTISRRSMNIMNSFVNDLMAKIAEEAGRLVAKGKKSTMSARDIQAAVKLVIPGELATHSINEGLKSITKHSNSYPAE